MPMHALRVAFRSFRRQKGYATLNVTGLAVGIACCLLIALFVWRETSFDRFHANADRIYRVVQEMRYGAVQQAAVVSGPVAPALAANIPEVEHTVRVLHWGGVLSRDGVPTVEAEVAFTDPGIFDVFSFPFLRGDAATALVEPYTVVLTETLARNVFGDADPIGRTVRLYDEDLRVTGVMADVPTTSHLQFEALASFVTRREAWLEDWSSQSLYTYVRLREGASAEAVDARLPALLAAHVGADGAERNTLYLQPLRDIHFTPGLLADNAVVGDPSVVVLFAVIALFILLIASINYVNLATARSIQRMREVGVRKALGAPRAQLVRQFLGESFVMAGAALALGAALAVSALPLFNRLLDLELAFNDAPLVLWVAALLGLFLLVGLLAGVYPALHLSRFRPVVVLKGTLPAFTGGATFRRALVVGQFAVSVALVAAVGVAYQQLNYVQTAPLGFDEDYLVSFDDADPRTGQLKEALAALPQVAAVAASDNMLGEGLSQTTFHREGTTVNEDIMIAYLSVDPDFIPTTVMAMAAGRNFSEAHPTDSTSAVVLNETAARAFGWPSSEAAVGGRIVDGDDVREVIGVVRDFNFASLHEAIEPQMFLWQPSALELVTVRLRPGDLPGALAALETIWTGVIPDVPFNYAFVDERLAERYSGDTRLGLLFGAFALLAIGLACLGLFGLAAFTAERRTKEIGVRKVLGASAPQLAALLTRDFLALVLMGSALAVPAAYVGMRRWLEGFAYHVEIGPAVFVAATALTLLVALAAVSTQALRAATADPVEALRSQ